MAFVLLAPTSDFLTSPPNYLFFFLFIFRYLRLVVHLISFWLYRPSPILKEAFFSNEDVTVVIPTIDPSDLDFLGCLQSVLMNQPKEVCIVTVGSTNRKVAEEKASYYGSGFPDVQITVSAIGKPNKRKQIASALPNIHTAITILADDHVFWPSNNFLSTIIAPFEDAKIGAVAPHKRVRRHGPTFGWTSFYGFLGSIYLERHNFELRATNAMDGGLFVVSGRTAAFRTGILQDPEFLHHYTNERLFFGMFSLPNADDDNCITRWVVRKGWKLKFQQSRNSTMETTLGAYPKFMSQVLRWNRTTIRSNSASLLTDRTVWTAQPWCVYAVYLTSFVNFALFYDAALVYTLTKTTFFNTPALVVLGTWVALSKLIKLVPHLCRHPADLIYLPGYYVFAYAHSFIKLYAMLTFWNTHWGGRNLKYLEKDPSDVSDSQHAVGENQFLIGDGVKQDHLASKSLSIASLLTFFTQLSSSSNPSVWANSFSTPWGKVKPENLHTTPATALQSRQATWKSTRQRKGNNGTPDSSDPMDISEWWEQTLAKAAFADDENNRANSPDTATSAASICSDTSYSRRLFTKTRCCCVENSQCPHWKESSVMDQGDSVPPDPFEGELLGRQYS
jgi:cellulose synthase/poly-beta-1,6-N-acetylglucosamine synthase-like glycosyltransferase